MKIQKLGIVLMALAGSSENALALRGKVYQAPKQNNVQADALGQSDLHSIIAFLANLNASGSATWNDIELVAKELNINLPGNLSQDKKDYYVGLVNGSLDLAESIEKQQQNKVFDTVKVVQDVAQALSADQRKAIRATADKVFNIVQVVSDVSAMANLEQDFEKSFGIIPKISELLSENNEKLTPELVVDAIKELHLSRYSEEKLTSNVLADFRMNKDEVSRVILNDVYQYRAQENLKELEVRKEDRQVFNIVNVVSMVQESVKNELVDALNAGSEKLDAQAQTLAQSSEFQALVHHLRSKDIRLNSFVKLDKAISDISSVQDRQLWKEQKNKMSNAEKESMLSLYQDAIRLHSADEVLADTSHTRANDVYEVNGRSQGKAGGSVKPAQDAKEAHSALIMNLEKQATAVSDQVAKVLSSVEKLYNSLPYRQNKQQVIETMKQREKEAIALDDQVVKISEQMLQLDINPLDSEIIKNIISNVRKIVQIVEQAVRVQQGIEEEAMRREDDKRGVRAQNDQGSLVEAQAPQRDRIRRSADAL